MRGLPDIYVRLPTQSGIYTYTYIYIQLATYVASYKDCFLNIVKYHGNKINRANYAR